MNLQYISDANGQTTGVFIPIEEWNALKEKFQDIPQAASDVPAWQIAEVRKRVNAYQANPNTAEDFDQAMNDIEKDL